MNQDGANLMAQLRDIHVAPDAPFWPPAPGWWFVGLLVLIVLAIGLRWLLTHLRAHMRRRRTLQFLDGLRASLNPLDHPQSYLSGVNQLLKLVAIQAFPGQHCAAMQGRKWTEFLAGRLSKASSDTVLAALAEGPYQPTPEYDPQALHDLARNWIRSYG